MIALYVITGLIMGGLKVAIESGMWDKEKDERKFHGTGLAIVIAILTIEYIITDYTWEPVVVTWLVYWNTFEIINNLFHDKDLFYVGETANFDKALRWATKYHERLKFFIQLATVIAIIVILIYLNHEKI